MDTRERLHTAVLATELAGLTPMALELRVEHVLDDMELNAAELAAELAADAEPAGLTATTLITLFGEWRKSVEADVFMRLMDPPPAETMMDSGEKAMEQAHDDEAAYCRFAEHDNRWQNGG